MGRFKKVFFKFFRNKNSAQFVPGCTIRGHKLNYLKRVLLHRIYDVGCCCCSTIVNYSPVICNSCFCYNSLHQQHVQGCCPSMANYFTFVLTRNFVCCVAMGGVVWHIFTGEGIFVLFLEKGLQNSINYPP